MRFVRGWPEGCKLEPVRRWVLGSAVLRGPRGLIYDEVTRIGSKKTNKECKRTNSIIKMQPSSRIELRESMTEGVPKIEEEQ